MVPFEIVNNSHVPPSRAFRCNNPINIFLILYRVKGLFSQSLLRNISDFHCVQRLSVRLLGPSLPASDRAFLTSTTLTRLGSNPLELANTQSARVPECQSVPRILQIDCPPTSHPSFSRPPLVPLDEITHNV